MQKEIDGAVANNPGQSHRLSELLPAGGPQWLPRLRR
jgi:hypothetical protein